MSNPVRFHLHGVPRAVRFVRETEKEWLLPAAGEMEERVR